MRWSQSIIRTLREAPREATAISHGLMLRAGLVRRLSAGLYTYLPLGLRVIRRVEEIIRQEMNKKGAQELLMPILQPKEVWEQSGRWDDKELGMLKLKNREEKEFVLGPTHEEIITDLVSKEVRSYKELPLNLYQIQTKFRDEMRPRFGMVRAREFIMKDAYSFDGDENSASRSYQDMSEAYSNIFRRCGLKTEIVEADPGAMGGNKSEEFIALSDSGEDIIVSCPQCPYASNLESAQRGHEQSEKSKEKMKPLQEIRTPEVKTIKELKDFLGEKPEKMIKTLIYLGDGKTVAVLISGQRELSEVKLRKHLKCENLEMADETLIEKVTAGPLGFSGPVGLKKVKIIADVEVTEIVNGITGANRKDKHIRNVNMGRDYNPDEIADISYVKKGDRCPKCSGKLAIREGIEVGHIFTLGRRYSQRLGAKFLNERGEEKFAIMGCYGIGITRTVAAIIEQNHGEDGILWPISVSPYQVHIILLNVNNREAVKEADKLYDELTGEGVEVLLDDRDERAGVKFKDADLIGVPLHLVISPKTVSEKRVEIKRRRDGKDFLIAIERAREEVKKLIQEELSIYG